MATGRPVLRIDRVGIHYGRSSRTRISWDPVATISDPIGRWFFAYVNVRPHDGRPHRLPVNHFHVQDLDAFAVWLRARLDEHRALRAPAD